MKRAACILGLGILAALMDVWWMAARKPVVAVSSVPQGAVVSASPSASASAAILPTGAARSGSTPPLPAQGLADELNAGGDPARDVVILHRLLTLYQRALHGRQGSPVGDDSDLARVLKGGNPMKQVFIPAGHPALAADGHLVDRWGTPYQVHPRGREAFEVRSAGPDRQMFTADDLVMNAPPERR